MNHALPLAGSLSCGGGYHWVNGWLGWIMSNYVPSIDPSGVSGGIMDRRVHRPVAEGIVCTKRLPPRGQTAHDISPSTGSRGVLSY